MEWVGLKTVLEAPKAPANKNNSDLVFGCGGLGTPERFYTGEIGVPWPNLPEPDRLVVKASYQVSWERETLNLAELARLRWIEKWQIERIAIELGYTVSGIKAALARIKADPLKGGITNSKSGMNRRFRAKTILSKGEVIC